MIFGTCNFITDIDLYLGRYAKITRLTSPSPTYKNASNTDYNDFQDTSKMENGHASASVLQNQISSTYKLQLITSPLHTYTQRMIPTYSIIHNKAFWVYFTDTSLVLMY